MSTHDLTSSPPNDSAGTQRQPKYPGTAVDYGPPAHRDGGRRSQGPTLLASVRRYWFLTLLPAIVLVAAGIVVGAKKHPTYSATATINVGKSDIATQATPGYVQAAEALASSYSRLVSSQHVIVPAARALNEPVGRVAGNLTAAPVPTEPTFTITSSGRSPRAAVELGNAAIQALTQFVNSSQTQQGSPAQMLSRYTAARTRADRLQRKSGSLQGRLAAHSGGVTPAQVVAAESAAQTAELQAQAIGNAYVNLGQTSVAPTLDVLNDPTGSGSSNRTSNIEKYAVVGAVAGLVIGMALAAMLGGFTARRRARRA